MNKDEIEEIKKISKNLFSEACDDGSLIYLNLREETLLATINLFFETSASKTDLNVMVNLMEYWDLETSSIAFESFLHFKAVTKSTLSDANLSRALKSLIDKNFITKENTRNAHNYIFNVPLNLMKEFIR